MKAFLPPTHLLLFLLLCVCCLVCLFCVGEKKEENPRYPAGRAVRGSIGEMKLFFFSFFFSFTKEEFILSYRQRDAYPFFSPFI